MRYEAEHKNFEEKSQKFEEIHPVQGIGKGLVNWNSDSVWFLEHSHLVAARTLDVDFFELHQLSLDALRMNPKRAGAPLGFATTRVVQLRDHSTASAIALKRTRHTLAQLLHATTFWTLLAYFQFALRSL
jgi:hypothetical protein